MVQGPSSLLPSSSLLSCSTDLSQSEGRLSAPCLPEPCKQETSLTWQAAWGAAPDLPAPTTQGPLEQLRTLSELPGSITQALLE